MKRIVVIFALAFILLCTNLAFGLGLYQAELGWINERNEDVFIVKGPKPWLDTGIDVTEGCLIILSSEGKVDVSAGWGIHDARGTDNFFANNNYPVNAKYRYGLAAQITSSASSSRDRKRDAWIYEYEGTHFAKKSGRLWLVVNDDNPQDNTGEFRVRVRTDCNDED